MAGEWRDSPTLATLDRRLRLRSATAIEPRRRALSATDAVPSCRQHRDVGHIDFDRHATTPRLRRSYELVARSLEPGDVVFTSTRAQHRARCRRARERRRRSCIASNVLLAYASTDDARSAVSLLRTRSRSRSSSREHARGDGSHSSRYVSISIEALDFTLPPLDEQRAIAHILGTLDDKIELNRRMNETLEAMARALFKSWFVDFDPVRAKAEGRDPGLPKPLADLFPDRLVDSELGEIPKGWRGEAALASVDGATCALRE